jgi:outer membrane protein
MKKYLLITAAILGATVPVNAEMWTLEQCIDYAVEHNLTVKNQEISKLSAELDVVEAKDNFLPNLSASASQSFNFGRGLTAENTYANRNTSNFQWGASMNMPLFQGLSNVRQVKYAKANLRKILYDYEAAKENITLSVISQYLQVLYCSEILDVAQKQKDLSTVQLARSQELLDAGKIPELDIYEAKSQLAQDELSVVNATNDYELALVDLMQMLELKPGGDFTVTPLSDEEAEMLGANQVYENALSNNNSILSAKQSIEVADRSIELAKSGYLPRLSFNAGVGSSYYKISGFENSSFGSQMKDNYNTYLGFSLSVPIFDAFSTRNSIRKAQVSKINAELQLQDAQNQLYKSIQQAFYQYVASKKKYEASEVAEASSQQAFVAMREKFSYGKANATEFEQSKTAYIKSMSERVQAKYETILRYRILQFYNKH